MRLVTTLFAGGVVASLCLSSFAQSTTGSNAQTTPAAQSPAPTAQTAPQNPAPLKLENLPPDPHTPTPEEQAAQAAERSRAQLTRVATAMANWGPASSTPGMTLATDEMARTKTDTGTQITYQLKGTGFPPDMKLTLVRWPLNQAITVVMDGIVLDASGKAICPGPDSGSCGKTLAANAPIEVTATVAKGEAVRVALVSTDRTKGAGTSVVPFPIASEDKGCKLQVVLGSKDGELVLLEGDGFKQDATFTIGSESYGQRHPLASKPNAQGHFVSAMTPWITGHDTGDTVIYYQSDSCTPTLSFHWGKGTYKVE